MSRQDAQKQQLEDMYQILDKNGDGKVTIDEIKDRLKGNPCADKLMELLDANKDGYVTKGEFMKAVNDAMSKVQH
uniref:uncharacterized protein n=1 Tax=Myxine glutinosa TaxID=7769 RepID=UPI00358DF378